MSSTAPRGLPALSAAGIVAGEDVSALDACVLGEPEILNGFAEGQIDALLLNAVAFGYDFVVGDLLKQEPSAQVLAKAVYTAVDIGREDAFTLLLKAIAATDYRDEVSPNS